MMMVRTKKKTNNTVKRNQTRKVEEKKREEKKKEKEREKKNKFDPNKDASNICENERIFLNLLEFN